MEEPIRCARCPKALCQEGPSINTESIMPSNFVLIGDMPKAQLIDEITTWQRRIMTNDYPIEQLRKMLVEIRLIDVRERFMKEAGIDETYHGPPTWLV